MPPRLQLLRKAAISLPTHNYQPVAPFLYPFLQHQHQQQRSASILAAISDNKGAYSKRIRRGRGPASGKGKTSGRGHKGQKQHGKVPAGFNGGQTPDWVVAGKRGFKNPFSVEMAPINLNRIQYWINQGRLDPSKPITVKELNSSRCIHRAKDGVKLLARGKEELISPIHLVVSRASAEAIGAVERAGGSVTTRYYTRFALQKIRAGEMDPVHSLQSRIALPNDTDAALAAATNYISPANAGTPTTAAPATARPTSGIAAALAYRYRLPDPTSRKDLEYYRDAAHRGYLSHMVGRSEGPSLFFRTPAAIARAKKLRAKPRKTAQGPVVDNRLW